MLMEIKEARIAARKEKDSVKANLLGTLLGDIENALKAPDANEQQIVTSKIKSFIKNLEEVVQYNESAKKEIAILEEFLPKQLTEDEIRNIFKENSLEGIKDRMSFLKKNYAGLYDGKMAAMLAKE